MNRRAAGWTLLILGAAGFFASIGLVVAAIIRTVNLPRMITFGDVVLVVAGSLCAVILTIVLSIVGLILVLLTGKRRTDDGEASV